MKPEWRVAPYFIVRDVTESAEFYRDKLGFEFFRYFGEPPSFTIMKRNGVQIMLKQLTDSKGPRPNRLGDEEGASWDAYIWVDDADALYDEFVAKGVTIARSISDQEYGCRDFDIEECNGYRISFGHDITS